MNDFCASSARARAMNDDEFWDAVFSDGKTEAEREIEEADYYGALLAEYGRLATFDDRPNGYYTIRNGEGEITYVIMPDNNCPVCGSEGLCGYDGDGRPWIHSLPHNKF